MTNSHGGKRGPANPDEERWSHGYLAASDAPDLPRVDSTFELFALSNRLHWLTMEGDASRSYSIWNQLPLAPGLLQEQRLASEEPGHISLEFRTLRKDSHGRLLTVGSHYFQVSLVQAQCVLEGWVKQQEAAALHQDVMAQLATSPLGQG